MIYIYTDGGARGNPGPAGIGVVFYNRSGKKLGEISKPLEATTNNQAEYQAVLAALKKIRGKHKRVHLSSDSQLLVNQLSGRYRIKSKTLMPLIVQIKKLEEDFESVDYTYLPREEERIQEADRLVNLAMDRAAGK